MTDEPSPRRGHAETAPLARLSTPAASLRLVAVPDIASAEWDLLFQAVLDRLEALADVPEQLAMQGAEGALSECIAALDQLRNSAARPSQSNEDEPRY